LSMEKHVVSDGRALNDRKKFNATLELLDEVLGAAVGTGRAALNAGHADNSPPQVAQTGKIATLELAISVRSNI
jgi:electron transfer flavoprotein alpha subunit